MPPQYLLPQELTRPPIEEAAFGIQFQSASGGAVDRLPVALRHALGAMYPRSEDESAAAGGRDRPALRLIGQSADVSITHDGVRLRVGAPFPGWDALHARIDEVLDAIEESKAAGAVQHISLKFVNILQDVPPRQLEALRVDLRVNGDAAPESGLRLRMELSDERYVRVVDIEPSATGPQSEGRRAAHGLLLALECRREFSRDEFWPQRTDALENIHFELRALFFRLLARSAVEKLGPIYREPPAKDG